MVDLRTLRLDSWETPATSYPEEEYRGWRIKRIRYNRGLYEMYGIDGHILFEATKPLQITTLQEKRGGKWHQWMVDDPPHWRAMQIYGEAVEGRVLSSGLGLGLFQHCIAKNPRVTQHTKIERSAEVWALIWGQVPHNLNITQMIIADLYNYIDFSHGIGEHWDWIMVDLWVARGAEEKLRIFWLEVLPTVAKLKTYWPEAKIIVHGFSNVSDVKLATPEALERLEEFHSIE